jgi:hypothetical protein
MRSVEAPVDRLPTVPRCKAAEAAGLPIACLSLQKPLDGTRTELSAERSLDRAGIAVATTVAPLPREQSIAVRRRVMKTSGQWRSRASRCRWSRNIQVDWTQYGPKLAQVALTFGANDLDRVSTVDDESLGRGARRSRT